MVQKKKSDEQDVLVVRDEKTGEISVVAGLSRDGTPKRVPAKAENTSDFLRFDRNSDLMDSFFRNLPPVQRAKPIWILSHRSRPGGKHDWCDEGVAERFGG